MKKLITVSILIIAVAFMFVGCGAKQTATKGSNKSFDQNGGRQQFNQGDPADIIGEVGVISGNNISLKIMAMPARPSGSPDATKPSGAPQQRGQVDRQTQYTGEEQTVTISDSTPITTFSRGGNDPQKSNIKVSDIKKGDRLQVWYDDKEKKTISRISVMPQRNPASASPSPAAK